MSISLFIYLADVLQNVQLVFGLLSVFVVIVLGGVIFASIEDYERGDKATIRKCLYWMALPAFLIMVATLVPSPKTMYTIAGVEIAQEIVKFPEVSDKLEKVSRIIDQKLDEMLEEDQKPPESLPEAH